MASQSVPPLPANASLSEIETVDLPTLYGYAGFKKMDFSKSDEVGKIMGEVLGGAYGSAAQKQIPLGKFAFSGYVGEMDESSETCDSWMGFTTETDKPTEVKEGMFSGVTLMPGKYVKITLTGPYDGIKVGWTKLHQHLKEKGLKYRSSEDNTQIYMYELYHNDPASVRPEELKTEIFAAFEE
jgi:predicted transcriptional regulator YdeE